MIQQFEKIQKNPSLVLPMSLKECEDTQCNDCVMHGFLDNNGCQFSAMLECYRMV